MIGFAKLSSLCVAALALVGCAGMEVQSTRNANVSGSDFHKGLYAGYLNLSESEYAEGDYQDSDVFARRAKTAAAGKVFGPEPINARKLPADKTGELSAARERLVAALDGGGRSKAAMKAAEAQTMFDCWMQEQEENRQPKDIAACRAGFTDALAAVEDAIRPVPVAAAPQPAPTPKAPLSFLVYFDFDSAKIADNQHRVISDAVAAVSGGKTSRIMLSAHADRAGDTHYNQELSERRAMAVKAALAERGLVAAKIESAAYGETRPYVDTPDGKSEKQNRVVFVSIEE